MVRKDWYYPSIPIEMAEELDRIAKEGGRKHGIYNKNQLITTLLSDFIEKYDETKNMRSARKANLGNAVNISSKAQNSPQGLDNIVKLFHLIGKHADERPCKHSFLEVLAEIREHFERSF